MSAAECIAPLESDEHLIERTLAGEREAFDQLYARYIGRIYRFVDKRLRNRDDVEETVQEVFIHVFSSLASFRAEAPFAAWVLGIARHTISGRFKRKQHPTVPLDLDADGEYGEETLGGPASRTATPHELYELRERIERLEETVARYLSPEQQQLFRLHHIEHLPIAEIAAHLDKSEDAVKSNLYRTRRLLLSR
jgi:RNA polymerase sigma-70 factor (ECF subfamily)